MGSMEADGASTETENLTREEQRDTIEPRLNENFQSESAERSTERERGLTWELSESRDTLIVSKGVIGSHQTLVKLGCILNARERATIMA